MKKLLSLLCLLALTGCATTEQAPPSNWEQKFYEIKTNLVARVYTVTNYVPVTNYVTAVVTNTVDRTNVVVVPVQHVEVAFTTNVVRLTNEIATDEFTPGTNAARIVDTTRAVGNMFGPWGDLIGAILGGAFGLYGVFRSRKAGARADAAETTAAALCQVIEVGREIIARSPQGAPVAEAWKSWMIQHQAEQGVIENVVGLLETSLDKPAAKDAAAQLVALMQDVKK